jgi:hypothetical protein
MPSTHQSLNDVGEVAYRPPAVEFYRGTTAQQRFDIDHVPLDPRTMLSRPPYGLFRRVATRSSRTSSGALSSTTWSKRAHLVEERALAGAGHARHQYPCHTATLASELLVAVGYQGGE